MEAFVTRSAPARSKSPELALQTPADYETSRAASHAEILRELLAQSPEGQEENTKRLIEALSAGEERAARDNLELVAKAACRNPGALCSGMTRLWIEGFSRLDHRDLDAIFKLAAGKIGLDVETGEAKLLPRRWGHSLASPSLTLTRGPEIDPVEAAEMSPLASCIADNLLTLFRSNLGKDVADATPMPSKVGQRFIDSLALALECIGAQEVSVKIEQDSRSALANWVVYSAGVAL